MSSPICYITTIALSLSFALMLFANHHVVQTKRMLDDLPEIRAELEAMEGEINELIEESGHGLDR